VADGVFFAELNEMLTRELAEDGYSGVEVRVTPMRTEIIIRATRTQNVLGMCDSATPFRLQLQNSSGLVVESGVSVAFRREGQEDQGTYFCGSEALQLPGGRRRALRREGEQPRPLRHCPG